MNLKLLQLNAWTGRIKDGLTRFIKEGDFDVVCLQEAIWDAKHTNVLENYIDTVEKIQQNTDLKYDYRSPIYGFEIMGGEVQFVQGNVILSKIPFTKTEEKMVYGQYKIAKSTKELNDMFKNRTYGCSVEKATLKDGPTIFNYHGYWEKDPLGSATTVECMKIVAEMIKKENTPVILCGDLNIVHESPAMRELDFLQDLTATNHTKSTLMGVRFKKDVACDHILISQDITCKKFEVLDEILSDHKALIAELLY